MKIFDKIVKFYQKELPFVVYRKPNDTILYGFFMNDNSLFYTDDFSESGFVFAPFNADEKAILFPLQKTNLLSEKIDLDTHLYETKEFSNDSSSKENHINLVEKAIKEINKSELQKVVISRKEDLKFSNFDLLSVYKNLLEKYNNAFVYLWFHPKVGLWLGATPETLLHVKESSFKTMSLAGTQVYEKEHKSSSTFVENVVWKSKELEEQHLVTNFIENQLKNISKNLIIDKTETIKAGSLLHLRTKIDGDLKENSTLKSLIRALHPTPAVCGLPRTYAKDFILENENYYRSYYTGFLGELNLARKSSLYVNLRCMEIKQNIASIYVGGGITKDSDAEKEWEETVSKSKTMKSVL